MIELPAAKVEAFTDRVYVMIPRDHMGGWQIIREWLKLHKVDQLYVKIGKVRKPRTTGEQSQNHALNGIIQQICSHTGEDFGDTKMEIKRRAINRGYPFRTALGGDPIPQSETDCDTVECGLLIDEARDVASFCGVRLRGF